MSVQRVREQTCVNRFTSWPGLFDQTYAEKGYWSVSTFITLTQFHLYDFGWQLHLIYLSLWLFCLLLVLWIFLWLLVCFLIFNWLYFLDYKLVTWNIGFYIFCQYVQLYFYLYVVLVCDFLWIFSNWNLLWFQLKLKLISWGWYFCVYLAYSRSRFTVKVNIFKLPRIQSRRIKSIEMINKTCFEP